MFRLRIGYLISGIITGIVLLFSFISTLPDGRLHIYFCNVGQGDAAYVKFPDGRDMLIDGGPDKNSVINCLSRHMPFWDRKIDLVVLSHPQKDHLEGLISVLQRFAIGYFVHSDIDSGTEGYHQLLDLVKVKNVTEKKVVAGEKIDEGIA
jgi:competence protein ComEC